MALGDANGDRANSPFIELIGVVTVVANMVASG
jgi:hypothetical protein